MTSQRPSAPNVASREFNEPSAESRPNSSKPGAAEDYALVIGINHYPDLRPLRGAIADAQAFEKWLIHPLGGNIPQSNVRLVISSSNPLCPLGPEIDVEFEQILERAERVGGRRFYFYFSGHGAVGDRANDLALCMADWSNRRRRAALSSEAWLDVVVRSGIFSEVAFFLDCCRVWATRAVGMPPRIDFVAPSTPSRSTRVFMAYATEFQRAALEATEYAPDKSPESRGIFTRVLIDTLQSHAATAQSVPAAILKQRIEEHTEKKAREFGFYQRAEVLNGFADTSAFGATQFAPTESATDTASHVMSSPMRNLLRVRRAVKPWCDAYEEFCQQAKVAHQRPRAENKALRSRLQVIVFSRQTKHARDGRMSEQPWSICSPFASETPHQHDALLFSGPPNLAKPEHLRPISLTGSSPKSHFLFSGNLSSGAYFLRYQGSLVRDFAVRVFRDWTTLVVMDGSPEPHFENAKVFLLPYKDDESLPPWKSLLLTAGLMMGLHWDLQMPGNNTPLADSAMKIDDPMLGLLTGHLLARIEKPDPDRIENIAKQVKELIGPCSDVDALLLRAAVIRGREIPLIRGTTPPMLRAGLIAFLEASQKRPQSIPAWSWLEYACIERLVDSPITSWAARLAPKDKSATYEDSIDDLITQSLDELATTDAHTIARELSVPTVAVATRLSLTRNRTTRQSGRKTSVPPPPGADDDDAPTSLRPTQLLSPPPPSSSNTAIPKARRSNLPPPGSSLFPAIPGYEIERPIGKGGMGEVYLARRFVNGERIAIKVIQEDAAISVKGRRRFLREIDTLAILQHPRIVAMLEHGYANGYFYFTMPYYKFGNVADWVKQSGRVTMDQACRVMLDVLEGLAYAHQLGFVHRDIKPQNLLVDNQNRFLLADFGLAKEVEKSHDVDSTGNPMSWAITTRRPGDFKNPRWMGTPEFMPPEQKSNFREVRASADIWAIARVFYWLLCGVTPQTTLPWGQANDEFERRHGWPMGLTNLLAMAMSEESERRPANAGLFRKMLEGIIRGSETRGK